MDPIGGVLLSKVRQVAGEPGILHVCRKERSSVGAGERKEGPGHEVDGSCRPLDVEKERVDPAQSVAAPVGICARPRQTGSNPASAPLSV